jgi:hypothetical protein
LDFVDFIDVSTFLFKNIIFQKCVEWKTDSRLTPEIAFAHPFISNAVNELKGMRDGPSTVVVEKHDGLAENADEMVKNTNEKVDGIQQKKNNNSKNKIANFSNGSGTSVVQTHEIDLNKVPQSARSNQSDVINAHPALPKISKR